MEETPALSVPAEEGEQRPVDPDAPAAARKRDMGRVYRACLGAALALALSTPFWAIRGPELYRSECVLQYDREPVSGAANDWNGEEWYATQDFLLASKPVLERVVDVLHLEKDRGFFGVAPKRPFKRTQQDALSLLLERLSIRRVEGTRLVRVGVEDPEPQRAARIANLIAESYLQKAATDREGATSHAVRWLGEQLEQTHDRLSQTENELRLRLEREPGSAMPLAERQQMITTEIKRLNDALTEARVERIKLAARAAKLKQSVGDDPFDVYAQEVADNEQVKQLRAEQLAARMRYQELAAAQGGASTQAELERNKLDALRAQLRLVVDGIVRGAQAELNQALEVESSLGHDLERANATGHSLQLLEIEYGRLQRERAAAEGLLESLRERSTAARVAAAAGASGARVVEPATPARKPIRHAMF